MFEAFWRRGRRLARHEQVVLSILAVVVGIVVAYAAIGFRTGIGGVQWLGFGFSDEAVFSQVSALPWWQVVAVPVAGGLIVGLFLQYVMPGQRPQAVAQVIEAVALNNGRMKLKDALYAACISITSLGAGASAGREGPMVHLGAGLAAFVAERLHLSASLSRTILGCGVAAAVAASFNAPIAGVFFALEVVIGHYALSAFAPVVIASVAGTVISRIHLGAQPAFILPPYDIVSLWEYPAFLLLGAVCAAIAMLFMWSIIVADRTVTRVPAPLWLKPVVGGLLVGLLAIELPHVLGVGYEATDAALKELFPLWLLLLLIVAKTTATAISLGCRFGGGVFSPSLFIGAMTGGAFGIIAASVFPELAADGGLYAIIGMSATAAAVLGAPMSTILIVFELTGDYSITIAVMVATSTATVIVQQVLGHSFFHWQLASRGMDLRGGRARHLLQALIVRDVIAEGFQLVVADTLLGEVKRTLRQHPDDALLVVDEAERFSGVISFTELSQVAFDPELDNQVRAADLVRTGVATATAGESLEDALARMERLGEDLLVVVDDEETRRVRGIVYHKDVLWALNRALLEAQAEEHDDTRRSTAR